MRKNVCAAKNCNEIIQKERIFCIMHWSFLDAEIQSELVDHYTPGQVADRRRIKKKFRVALEKARIILYQDEQRYE